MSGLTLEVVEKAFAQWREQRTSRFESIPQKLFPKYKKRSFVACLVQVVVN
jgi:hypothetical protein